MSLRLKSLQDMKDDMLIKRSLVSGELLPTDYLPRAAVSEFNSNDVSRKILTKPFRLLIEKSPRQQWLNPNQHSSDGVLR